MALTCKLTLLISFVAAFLVEFQASADDIKDSPSVSGTCGNGLQCADADNIDCFSTLLLHRCTPRFGVELFAILFGAIGICVLACVAAWFCRRRQRSKPLQTPAKGGFVLLVED